MVTSNLDYASFLTRSDREEGREEGLIEGMEKGILEGMEKGIEKGIEKGVEKGRIEGQIIAYLEMNVPIDEIAEKFKLSVEEIKKFSR
ncbi:hypothetical protein AN639_00335 [Candidatus Epulonipiscium fishelsonii]|nr:hypothetical protein AN639_00335 [Epulopiscium sp. SCG-B05WGA-EpuloA1]